MCGLVSVSPHVLQAAALQAAQLCCFSQGVSLTPTLAAACSLAALCCCCALVSCY